MLLCEPARRHRRRADPRRRHRREARHLRLARRARRRRAWGSSLDLVRDRGAPRPRAPRARDARAAGSSAELEGEGITRAGDPRGRVRGSDAGEPLHEHRRGLDGRREADRPRARCARGRLARLRRVGILVPFLALFLILSLTSESFATKANLLNILDQQSAMLIIAAAGTLVLVAGGIDLSVGAIYSLRRRRSRRTSR